LAVKTFKTLVCEGLARVDFFLKDNGDIFVNEINTIPGFTKISMYPKLWEASGISYTELIDRLIQLAIERFQKEQKLLTNYFE
jgi:D-alanine-D-alanine ligase